MISDRGTWTPESDPHKGYAKGHLDFDLHREKLHGRWHLVRMRPREGERHENWLLIKGKDEEARGPRDRDILEEKPRSVATGRSMEEIAAGKEKTSSAKAAARPVPAKPQDNSKAKAQSKQKIQKPVTRPLGRPSESKD